jgi:hypothetical protein
LRSASKYSLADIRVMNSATISRQMAADVLSCDSRLVSKAIKKGEFATITLGARPMILRIPFIERVSGAKV